MKSTRAATFFGTQHTIDRYQSAFYEPILSDWRNYESWEEAGALSATQRATAVWKQLLADYQAAAARPGHRGSPGGLRRPAQGRDRPRRVGCVNAADILRKIVAALTLVAVLPLWRDFSFDREAASASLLHTAIALAVVITLLSGTVAVAGLWLGRRVGFYCFYLYGVLATLLLGVSLIPFLPQLIPPEARLYGVLAINVIVLAVVAVLHLKSRNVTADPAP